MRRPALCLLLAFLSIAWLLASCRPDPASPVPLAPTATALATATRVADPQPSATYTPLPRPTPTASPAPTSTPPTKAQPSPSPAPDTPTPTLPPVLSPEAGQQLSLSLDWRLDANGHLTSGLIWEASGPPLFLLGSLGRTVYALSEEGQVAWRLRTSGPVYALAQLDGNQAAAGDDAGNVTAFDANGKQLWQVALGSRVTALHGGWQGGLLAGGWDERLSFLDSDGGLRWQANVDGPVSGIAALPNLALASTLHGEVASFDATGAKVWRFQAGAPITSIGTAGNRTDAIVLLALQDGRLLALSPDGAQRWQQQLSTAQSGGPVWQLANLTADAAPEIIVGTGGAEPNLALLSAGGDMLWRRAMSAPVGALAAVDVDGDGLQEILAGLASGEVQAYDRQGRLRGSVQAGLQVWGVHATGDGTALVRADVAVWNIGGGDGPTGGAWLHPPGMIDSLQGPLPVGTERQEGETILVFLGDVAPGRSMEAQLARYGPAYPWAGLQPLLQEADWVSANLEGVLATRGDPLDKSYLIRAHPDTGETLQQAGFNLVHLANNHALDFGEAALDQTLSTLETLGIAFVGAGSSPDMARRPAEFTASGLRVAVLGYAATRWNGSQDVPATDLIAWANVDAMQADVRAVRDRVDLVIVHLHAGTEYAASPSPDQVRFARAAIDAGANLVVGHHPHVTQTVEQYKGGLIVYSLGDALFDIPRPAAMRGHLLRVHVTQEGLGQAELWPFWIADSIQPRFINDGQGQPQFRIVYP